MSDKKRNLLVLAIGITLGVGIAIGTGVWAERTEDANTTIPLDDLRAFTEVFAKIKSDYVEPVDDKVLLEHAISGMLSNLDPHSSYLDAESYKELQVGTSGEFGGLGIEVTMENGFVKVMSPIDDTPAQKAGLRTGDIIIRLDSTPVKGLSLKDAVDIMRGKPGTDILLTVIREGAEKPLKFTLTRAIIKVKSVKSRSLEKGFGYLRITQFQSHTPENLIEAIGELKRENGGELKGLVLDLRNNPGGVLSAAVSVSDAFLESGLIVYTEGRVKDSEMKFKATPSDVLNGSPIVVLINAGSASASEIVAGALQDHHRAVIMGEKSFGKGSVQTIVPIGTGAALKLTTARYYTPSGRSIQAEGINPDIPLVNVTVAAADAPEFEPVKESNLTGHLENGKEKDKTKEPAKDKVDPLSKEGAGEPSGKETKKDAKEQPLAKTDYQLHEALNLLKGLNILQQKRD
ncbi:MAG: S41 family peptidase [Pseudomonadota bacterium]